MGKFFRFFVLVHAFLTPFIAWAEKESSQSVIDIDAVSSAVVMIRTEIIESIMVQGETYEIFLRKPGGHNIQPKILKKEGTGTLVIKGSDLYLVTVEHVAKDTALDSVIIMKVGDDQPEVIPITELVNKKRGSSPNRVGDYGSFFRWA